MVLTNDESATTKPQLDVATVDILSKRQLKKLRRADRDSQERQAKKRKVKRSANRFEAEAPKYFFAKGTNKVSP